MSTDADKQTILDHYRRQAEKHGDSQSSTMEDEVIRSKEAGLIERFFDVLGQSQPLGRVLELGCGNAYMLERLAETWPNTSFFGMDFSLDMLQAARRRAAVKSTLRGDARALPIGDQSVDAVFTERCLINILSWPGQQSALEEIARVLRPGGTYLMIECFTDGLELNNRARTECGLDALEPAFHNRYFDKDLFFAAVTKWFDVVSPEDLSPDDPISLASNFLSSHYFVARVLHPLITRGPWIRNTEFVKFFSDLPPKGNYSPIQSFILQRRPS